MARRTHRSERGATLLEFAIVLPLLLILAFGTAEMGMAWVANNQVEGSASTAARIGASSGSQEEADANLLNSLRSSLSAEQRDNVDRIVVFRSVAADGSVPAGCIKPVGSGSTAGVNDDCNSYPGSVIQGGPITLIGLGTADDFWAPTTREDNLVDPPDYLGVWIRTSYDAKTGTFFDDMTITKSSIYRIQPDIDG